LKRKNATKFENASQAIDTIDTIAGKVRSRLDNIPATDLKAWHLELSSACEFLERQPPQDDVGVAVATGKKLKLRLKSYLEFHKADA